MVKRLIFPIAALLALGAFPTAAAPQTGALRAGAAKVDITPPQSALKPGDSVRDPLMVRALVIDNGVTCAVLVSIEQDGADPAMVRDAAPRVTRATGCPADNLIISPTQTHSGSAGGLGGLGAPDAKTIADAVVAAATAAKSKLKPARIGFGTSQLYLNMNKDLFDGQKWVQGLNPQGPSDKTLAVMEVLDNDDRPIAVYMDYAMIPTAFLYTGVLSGDFPGEASRYIEQRYPGAVALFGQGAAGDQTLAWQPAYSYLVAVRNRRPIDDRIHAPDAAGSDAKQLAIPVKPGEMASYKEGIVRTGQMVSAVGAILGQSVIDVMRTGIANTVTQAPIWGGRQSFSCPAREVIPGAPGQPPTYRDLGQPSPPIEASLLQIGDIGLFSANVGMYTEIWQRLRRESPLSKVMMITLADGWDHERLNYLYSNRASYQGTFQVTGSHLKPGCGEDQFVAAGLALIGRAKEDN
jgi:hypothetical protein